MSKSGGGSGKSGAGRGGGASGREESKAKIFAEAVSSGDIKTQAKLITDELNNSDWDLPFLPKNITIGSTKVDLTIGSDIHKAVTNQRAGKTESVATAPASQTSAATTSRGEKLRAKYGDIEQRLTAKYLGNSKTVMTEAEKNLLYSARSRAGLYNREELMQTKATKNAIKKQKKKEDANKSPAIKSNEKPATKVPKPPKASVATVRQRTPKSERIARAEARMAAQAIKAATQQREAFLAVRKARAEGNNAEAERQAKKLNKAIFREDLVGKRARKIKRIASPD